MHHVVPLYWDGEQWSLRRDRLMKPAHKVWQWRVAEGIVLPAGA